MNWRVERLQCALEGLPGVLRFALSHQIQQKIEFLTSYCLQAQSVLFDCLSLSSGPRISYTSTFRSVLPAAILSFQAPIPRPHDQSLSSGTTQIESPALPRSNDVLTSFPSLT